MSELDKLFFDRAMFILHRMATERTGWRSWFSRWYYSAEPLRHDASSLVRHYGFHAPIPDNTQIVNWDKP